MVSGLVGVFVEGMHQWNNVFEFDDGMKFSCGMKFELVVSS